jgi:protease I
VHVENVEVGKNKKSKLRAVILTADKFEDMELLFPYFRLLEEGVSVDIAAPNKKTISGENGYSITPTKTMDEIDPEEYDILIIPGGFPTGAPMTVRKNPKALAITKAFFAKDKTVASICHGPYTLASADVVKGRHLTGFWYDNVPEDIKEAGGIYEDKGVVVDGNLVTSRWPPDLPAFMSELMKLVKKLEK